MLSVVLPCLSVRQPWAAAIIHLGKDVENRPWDTSCRGPLLIHASKRKPQPEEMAALFDLLGPVDEDQVLNRIERVYGTLQYGAVIGCVDLMDVVHDSTSPWAEQGSHHWLLHNPRSLPPLVMRGHQGLFNVKLAPHDAALLGLPADQYPREHPNFGFVMPDLEDEQ